MSHRVASAVTVSPRGAVAATTSSSRSARSTDCTRVGGSARAATLRVGVMATGSSWHGAPALRSEPVDDGYHGRSRQAAASAIAGSAR